MLYWQVVPGPGFRNTRVQIPNGVFNAFYSWSDDHELSRLGLLSSLLDLFKIIQDFSTNNQDRLELEQTLQKQGWANADLQLLLDLKANMGLNVTFSGQNCRN